MTTITDWVLLNPLRVLFGVTGMLLLLATMLVFPRTLHAYPKKAVRRSTTVKRNR